VYAAEYQRAIAREEEMQGEGWNDIGCLKWQLGCLDKRGGSYDFMIAIALVTMLDVIRNACGRGSKEGD